MQQSQNLWCNMRDFLRDGGGRTSCAAVTSFILLSLTQANVRTPLCLSYLCFFSDMPSERDSIVSYFLHIPDGAEALLVVSCMQVKDHPCQ